MKATDKQLIDISAELTAHIMKPTSDLHLNREECIILNRLISEEFERRQEQDVMGSSNGQDTPVGQSGSDNTDVTLDASECRDNEASGTSLREKKKPQITKVSKKEYWDNRDKHGTYLPTCDVTDQPEVPYLGFMPYPDEHIPVAWMHREVQKDYTLKSLFYSILSDWDFDADKYEAKGMALVLYPKWLYIPLPYIIEKGKDPLSNSRYQTLIDYWKQDRYMWIEYRPEPKPYVPKLPTPTWDEEWDSPYGERNKVTTNETTEEITQLDDFKDTDVSTEIKVSKGAMSIDTYKLFGQSFDEKCFRFNGVPLLDKYIPVAWMRERIEFNSPYADSYRKVIDSWNSFGKDLWYRDIHN